jgi:hypothetical protein
MSPRFAATLALVLLAGCAREQEPPAASPPPPASAAPMNAPNPNLAPPDATGQPQGTSPQPVFVMAQVVAVDANAHRLTVRPASGATSAAEVPAGRTPAAGADLVLPVDHAAMEKLQQVKPGDVVTLTCNMATPGGERATVSTPPDLTSCTSVTSLARATGDAVPDKR